MIAVVTFGLLFFLGHLVVTQANVRRATTRDDRLEALGLLVRGLAGLMLAVAVAARPWPAIGMALALAAILTLILGRAAYELVVFRAGPGR